MSSVSGSCGTGRMFLSVCSSDGELYSLDTSVQVPVCSQGSTLSAHVFGVITQCLFKGIAHLKIIYPTSLQMHMTIFLLCNTKVEFFKEMSMVLINSERERR